MPFQDQIDLSPIHVFIISWKGKHENALDIFNQLSKLHVKISIVYSDPQEVNLLSKKNNVIQRPNHLYWGDKFKTCLENCTSDNMLIIHADCQCHNWCDLVLQYDRAIKNISQLGVWSPKVNGTRWTKELTSIFPLKDSTYEAVAFIDGIVFGISNAIQKRMRLANYVDNIYGWGIGWLVASYAYVINKLLIIDSSINVSHPHGRGYDTKSAQLQEIHFRKQFTLQELIMFRTIRGYIHSRELQIMNRKNSAESK